MPSLSSPFSALSALLLASSFLVPSVLSLPAARPLQPFRRAASAALAARDASSYLDNIIYIDANETNLYLAIEVQNQTYAAYLDSQWGGLIINDGTYAASKGNVRTITVDESISIQVQDGRENIAIFDEEVDVEYFIPGSWPDGMPRVDYDGIKWAYMGIDMNDPINTMYSYMSAKWPQDYSKWYYDILSFYDWSSAYESSSPVDFAGVMVAGSALTWEDLGLPADYVSQYGLPDLMGINNQPYVWARPDGTFYIDHYFWINNKQVFVNSSVPKVDYNKVVVQIDISDRWSMFPDEVVNGLYGGVYGAKYVKQSTFGYYQIPCDTELSFSISIDGHKYAVFTESLVAKNPWGDQCIGSIFTKGEAVAAVPKFDIKFGFQFLSAFYYRSGLSQQQNSPYWKFLPIQPSNNNWKTASYVYGGASTTYSQAATTYSSAYATTTYSSAYATGSGTVYSYYTSGGTTYTSPAYTYGSSYASSSASWSSATPSSVSTYSSSYYAPSSSSSAWSSVVTYTYGDSSSAWSSVATAYDSWSSVATASDTWSSVATAYGGDSSSAYGYGSAYSSASYGTYGSASYSYGAYASDASSTPSIIAGNLAADDATSGSSSDDAKSWEDKAKLYMIIIIVLAALLGVGILGAIVACVLGRRNKVDGARPSAYRSIHDAESHEPKAPLYGAEGGASRYADPYNDRD